MQTDVLQTGCPKAGRDAAGAQDFATLVPSTVELSAQQAARGRLLEWLDGGGFLDVRRQTSGPKVVEFQGQPAALCSHLLELQPPSTARLLSSRDADGSKGLPALMRGCAEDLLELQANGSDPSKGRRGYLKMLHALDAMRPLSVQPMRASHGSLSRLTAHALPGAGGARAVQFSAPGGTYSFLLEARERTEPTQLWPGSFHWRGGQERLWLSLYQAPVPAKGHSAHVAEPIARHMAYRPDLFWSRHPLEISSLPPARDAAAPARNVVAMLALRHSTLTQGVRWMASQDDYRERPSQLLLAVAQDLLHELAWYHGTTGAPHLSLEASSVLYTAEPLRAGVETHAPHLRLLPQTPMSAQQRAQGDHAARFGQAPEVFGQAWLCAGTSAPQAPGLAADLYSVGILLLAQAWHLAHDGAQGRGRQVTPLARFEQVGRLRSASSLDRLQCYLRCQWFGDFETLRLGRSPASPTLQERLACGAIREGFQALDQLDSVALSALVRQLLARDPEQRGSAAEHAERLAEFMDPEPYARVRARLPRQDQAQCATLATTVYTTLLETLPC